MFVNSMKHHSENVHLVKKCIFYSLDVQHCIAFVLFGTACNPSDSILWPKYCRCELFFSLGGTHALQVAQNQ